MINYLTYEQALNLVDRIADRAMRFEYKMSDNEKEAMAQLLSEVGVSTSDLINVSNLADNYAINAEIVTPSDKGNYTPDSLQDALFTWEEDGETYYCLSW